MAPNNFTELGTEAEALNDWWDGDDANSTPHVARRIIRPKGSHYRGGDREQPTRWRCLTKGCNPKLIGEPAAEAHKQETGHRVAKWPVRSEEGKKAARKRNQSGYYSKYNVGYKDPVVRGIIR